MAKVKRGKFLCLDCGWDVRKTGEYYMLRDALWKRINPADDGMLCIACAEKRLGRQLKPSDFTDAPCNDFHAMFNYDLTLRVFGERPPILWLEGALKAMHAYWGTASHDQSR